MSFLSVFLVFKNLLFPYITSKQIFFNVLIEILFIFWIAFIIKYPEYRPKKSWITIGLLSYFAVLLVSSFFGVDFNLSFWGDAERMLGVFHLLHFLIFYLIIISVMRTWQDWRNLLLISVSASFILALYGIGERFGYFYNPYGSGRIVTTLGNSAYVGGFAIFNFFFALILLVKEKSKYLRAYLGLAIFLIFLMLLFSETRGAYLGFAFAMVFLSFLFSVFSKNKKIKTGGLAVFGILIIMAVGLFAGRNSQFIQDNGLLRRMTEFSMKSATMQTRLISWKTAFLDFPNHPVLGTGSGNFAISFDKYFDPKFLDHTTSETYFDRAHNNIVDIISTTGLLGIIAYLLIFGSAIYYLIVGFGKGRIDFYEFSIILALMAAYFIQNLVVFDSLVTYMSLMIMLGLIYYLYNKEMEEKIYLSQDRKLSNKEIYSIAGAGLLMFFILFQYNLKPYLMMSKTIQAQVLIGGRKYSEAIEKYQEALSANTILDRDSRTNLARTITGSPQILSSLEKEQMLEAIDFVKEEMEKNLVYNEGDSMMQLIYAQFLDTASKQTAEYDKSKSLSYSDQSLEAINKSISASPGRPPVYFVKSFIELYRGESDKAIETMKYAVNLNPRYIDSTCQLAKIYFALKQEGNAYEQMDKCLENNGAPEINNLGLIKILINHYIEKEDNKKVLGLYGELIKYEKGDFKHWINLAKLLKQDGQKENAGEAALKAAEINPELESSVKEFLKELDSK